jgi:glyoxylase-like metal-dependent hydrolase (beta-lactamase superfamily II)
MARLASSMAAASPTPAPMKDCGDPMRELLNGLEASGGGPAPFRLAFVCLTHPHDDHYGGLGRLLGALPSPDRPYLHCAALQRNDGVRGAAALALYC